MEAGESQNSLKSQNMTHTAPAYHWLVKQIGMHLGRRKSSNGVDKRRAGRNAFDFGYKRRIF